MLRRSRFDLPILLILVLELAQQRDPSVTATIRQCIPVMLTILLPVFLISRSLTNEEDVRRFLLAFTLAGFVMAAVAAVEARLHWLIYRQMEGLLHVPVAINGYTKLRAGLLRAPASFQESTTLGTFLVFAILAALASRRSFASGVKWWVVLLVLAAGLVSANSRGALIALAIGLVASDFYCRRYAALAVKVAAGGALYLFALVGAQFSTFFAGMLGKDSGTASTADYRVQLWHRGMEEINKHPLLGQNLKSALDSLQDLRQGEGIVDLVNGYIKYGLTLGYPGMIGLVMAFVSLCLAMLVARRKLQASTTMLNAAACVFAVGLLSIVNAFFTGFGGPISTAFYQMCALGSAVWAMRGLAPAQQGAFGVTPALSPHTGLAALIAADRAKAKAVPQRQRTPDPQGV